MFTLGHKCAELQKKCIWGVYCKAELEDFWKQIFLNVRDESVILKKKTEKVKIIVSPQKKIAFGGGSYSFRTCDIFGTFCHFWVLPSHQKTLFLIKILQNDAFLTVTIWENVQKVAFFLFLTPSCTWENTFL